MLLFFIFNFINPSYNYYFETTVPYNFNNFKSVYSENFIVSYPSKAENSFFIKENMELFAKQTSIYMEAAYKLITSDLKFTPNEKINVVLLDIYDSHNGIAYVVPENIIYIYTVPPTSISDLSEYDDWLWTTCVHELTHIINLSTTRDYSEVLNKIFGNILYPNGVWPMNLIEGIAVYNETKYSNFGRGRSSFYHAIIRTSFFEQTYEKVFRLSRAPYFTEEWPLGRVPYFYGYLLFEHIDKHYGSSVIGNISYSNSGKFPFFPSLSFEDFTSLDITTLWEETLEDNRIFYEKQIEDISKKELSKPDYLFYDENSYIERLAKLSPNKKLLAYYKEHPDKISSIVIYDLTTNTELLSINASETTSIEWIDDNNFLFNSIRKDRTKYYYNVFHYNISSKSLNIVQNSERIHYFTFFDNKLISIKAYTGVFKIISEDFLDFSLFNAEVLYSSNFLSRLSFVSIFENAFIFLEKDIDEEEKIISLKDGVKKVLYTSKGAIKFLKIFKNNIYFIDDSNGIFNIYKLNGKNTMLSNTATAILDFEFLDHNIILASYLNSYGVRLAKLKPFKSETKIETKNKINFYEFSKNTGNIESVDKDYDVSETIFPKFWLPILSFSDEETLIGLNTFGTDATFRNFYTLMFNVNAKIAKPNIDFYYRNSNFLLEPYLNIELESYRNGFINSYKTGFILPMENNFYLFKTDYLFWGFLFELGTENYFIDDAENNYQNYLSSGFYLQSYNTTPASFIFPEKGFLFQFNYSLYPDFISTTSNQEFETYLDFYIPGFFNHNVFKIKNSYVYETNFKVNLKNELRGYNSNILAKYYYVLNFDFLIPISRLNKGYDLYPIFLRNFYINLIFDYAYYETNNTEIANTEYKNIYNLGVELKLLNQVFYHVLSNFMLAYYRAPSTNDNRFIVGFVY